MIALFKKEHTNENFFLELRKKEFDEHWLKESLKSEFIDINHQDKEGNTFLLKCLKDSKYRAAEWLIKNGANIEIKNKAGKSAINIAIEKNSLPVVKGLLELGKIDVNQRDIEGRSLLQNVVVWGNHKMAKLLISKGADLNNTDHHDRNVLYDALTFGDTSFISYLLSFEQIDINQIDNKALSLLQHPEVEKNQEIAKDLLKAGIDPTFTTPFSESYLLTTILKGKETEDIVDTALHANCNVNAKTKSGNTLMMELIQISLHLPKEKKQLKEYYLETAGKMLVHGGDINATTQENGSVLFEAVQLRDVEVIAFLLSGGIDPNQQNDNGETPLFDIILDGIKSLDLIILFAAAKANPNILNQEGKSVYEILNDIILHLLGTKPLQDEKLLHRIDPKGEYFLVVKELLQRDDNNLDYLDSTGNPLFFNPLLYGDFPLFKLYINNRLNINATNHAGHNIFYEYVLRTFEKNDSSAKVQKEFEHNLSSLISHKVEKNYQDGIGWTIIHKILNTPCDEKLFTILTKMVLFDYTISDNLGRTVIHNAVWGNKPNIIEKIDQSAQEKIINKADNYGILPITYAALLGNKELVLLFLKLGSNIHSNKKIVKQAARKFSPMLKNLPKLLTDVVDLNDKEHLNSVIAQTKKDFYLDE